METLENLLASYGLRLVFLGAALEGDITPALAGVSAHLGYFAFVPALLVAWIGTLTADIAWYALGRSQAERWQRASWYQRASPLIQRIVDRFGVTELLVSRLVYGTRVASMIYWGARRLDFAKFLALDAVAAGVWVTFLTGLGYLLSNHVGVLLTDLARTERWLFGAVALTVTIFTARHWVRRVSAKRT